VSGYRLVKTYSMSLPFPPEKVFPLLCPVREYAWIESWQCELIHSDTGVAELDCVFKTCFPDDGPEDTWVVSRYEPLALIEFVRINALRSLRYSISLARKADGTTELLWKQIFTGLSPAGDDVLKGLSEQAYQERMATRERQINHFLSNGKMLKMIK
jgi:hypothetical protein